MNWRFSIDTVIVDEPVGWDGVSWTAQRHEHHGVLFASKTESFKWVGDAFTALETIYETDGADGSATLLIEYDCDNSGTYSTFFEGEFDFNTYRRVCGDMCWIEIALNPSNCVNKFLTRINTDVDVSMQEDLDGNVITQLPFESVELPSQTIVLTNRATSDGTDFDETQSWNLTGLRYVYVPMLFTNPILNEFNDFGMNSAVEAMYSKDTAGAITWNSMDDFLSIVQNLAIWQRTQDPLNCTSEEAVVNYRIKGTLNFTPQFNCTLQTTLFFDKYDTSEIATSGATPRTSINNDDIGVNGRAVTAGATDSTAFDISFSTTPGYAEANYLLFYFMINANKTTSSGSADNYQVQILIDDVSYFEMILDSDCDQTSSLMIPLKDAFYNINQIYVGENCPQVTWDVPVTGCYDNYHLTNGLLLRNVTDPAVPKLFTNFESLFLNTTKIFNLGWGYYDSEAKFTISPIEFFYANNLVVDLGSIREVQFTHAAEMTYGKINVGYSKWEAEEYTGLDEVCTLRTFRRKDAKIANELDLVSGLITAGYTWEITRRKNQSKTGTQDWRYDNDLFLLNTTPISGTVYAVQDNIGSPTDLISPSTRYNYILTPLRNLGRWFKSIAAPTPTIANAELQFMSGTGNYIAGGEVVGGTGCEIFDAAMSEDDNIINTDFIDSQIPLWKAITAEFDCPMTVSQFLATKADPYGYFVFSCGADEYTGFLMELDYRPNEGMATVKLLLNNQTIAENTILMEDSGDILMEDSGSILME